jgi:hypothetical protein
MPQCTAQDPLSDDIDVGAVAPFKALEHCTGDMVHDPQAWG